MHRQYRLSFGSLLMVWLCTLSAEPLVVPDSSAITRGIDLVMPQMGMTMRQVKKDFGAPKKSHHPVGSPPISRWDYSQYSVYFEQNRVIHAVVNQRKRR